MTIAKRALVWLAIAFVVYTIITAPTQAASMVQETFDGISTVGESLAVFFDALV